MAIISARFESKTHPDCGVACIVYKPGYGGRGVCDDYPECEYGEWERQTFPEHAGKSGTYTVKDNWVTFHAGYAIST